MSFSTVVFSSDKIRGALLSKAFQENGFEVSLHKNVHAAENVLKTKLPSLVVFDKEGYFRNELEHFSSLSRFLVGASVLVIANSAADGSISLKGVPVEWCLSNPLDLPLIVSKAKELLSATIKMVTREGDLKELLPITDGSDSSESETSETLSEDLLGFLGLK